MPRKSEPTCKTEQEIFPTRLKEIMSQKGIKQKELADAISMRPQTVSLYTTGQSAPDVNTLKKMCDFFNVSADYLLGITNVKEQDPNIQSICEYTMLTEDSISVLRKLSDFGKFADSNHYSPSLNPVAILNFLIANKEFQYALVGLSEMKGYSDSHTVDAPEDEKVYYYKFLKYQASTYIVEALEQFISSIVPDYIPKNGHGFIVQKNGTIEISASPSGNEGGPPHAVN